MAIKIVIRKNRLPDIARQLPEAAGVIVERNGKEAKATALRLVPYDTGELHDSIDFRMTGQTTGELVAEAPHAKFPEYGTHNQAAQPYLRPAAEQQRPKYEADFARLESFLR